MKETVGIIGLGKVGIALSIVFVKNDFTTYIAGKNLESSMRAHKISHAEPVSKEVLAKSSTFIILAVPDSQIKSVAREIAPFINESQIVSHLSGALDSSLIKFLKSSVVSIHPIKSFGDPIISTNSFKGTLFVCEGAKQSLSRTKNVVESIDGVFTTISSKNKVKYHLALTLASNFSILLAKKAEELLLSVGFSENDAQSVVLGLIEGTLSNMKNLGVSQALTGPVERGDLLTIRKHIDAIDDSVLKEFYIDGSKMLVDVAKKRHFIDNKYEEIEKFLKE
jgi:predicted short-subunit dehydrogenase-like oxidoreductase (DUF2520 family)